MTDDEGIGWGMSWPLLWRRIQDVGIFGAGWFALLRDSPPLEATTIAFCAAVWALIPVKEAQHIFRERRRDDDKP